MVEARLFSLFGEFHHQFRAADATRESPDSSPARSVVEAWPPGHAGAREHASGKARARGNTMPAVSPAGPPPTMATSMHTAFFPLPITAFTTRACPGTRAASVISSAYSNSPPTGTPCAIRVTRHAQGHATAAICTTRWPRPPHPGLVARIDFLHLAVFYAL